MRIAAIACLLGSTFFPTTAGWSEMKAFSGSGGSLNYYVFTPNGAAPDRPVPLVLFLHGGVKSNGKGGPNVPTDAFSKDAHQKAFPCFILRPVAIEGTNWVSPRGPGTASHAMPAEPAPSMKLLFELLEQVLKTHPIDRKQIHVTGASMGGYGTFDLASRKPDRFASVIPICGGGDPSKAELLKGSKVWIFHCVDDNVVPAKGSREMFDALMKARGEKPSSTEGPDKIVHASSDGRIRYTEYKTGKHFSWDKAYAEADLLPWMFK